MKQNLIALTKQMYEAYTKKDRAQIEAILHDDFHFTSPLDNRIDRATYFERCWPLAKNAGEFHFQYIHLLENDKVFVVYESKSLEARTFRNTEIISFKNGKATEVEVYFGWDIPHKAPAGGYLSEKP